MHKFLAVLRVSFIDAVAYRGDIFLYSLSGLIGPLSILLVWLAVSGSNSQLPMSSGDFIKYYLSVTFVGLWVSTWAGAFIPKDIRLGKLSPYLLKPMSYFHYQLGNNLGEKLVKTIFIIPAILVLGFFLHPGGINLSISNLLIFIYSTFLALLINLLLDVNLGLTAFWLDKSQALVDFFHASRYIFSGYSFPLIFLPSSLLTLSFWLPFRYTLALPIEILTGNPEFKSLITPLVIQLVWFIIAAVLYKFIWSQGCKKYSAAGS